MATLLTEWRDRRAERAQPTRDIVTVDDYAAAVNELVLQASTNWGFGPGQWQWQREPAERVAANFEGFARQLYQSNGLVYAVMGVRVLAFSLIRFSFQSMRNGRPGRLYGTQALKQLETPWAGGTTADLLMRMELDAGIAGNSYITRAGPDLVRLRPDWVQIILAPIEQPGTGALLGWRRVGYTYHDGGIDVCPPDRVALLGTSEVAHYAGRPDPEGVYRGESWLGAVIREIVNDKLMERHKTKFFENAATPNISVALSDQVSPEGFADFKEKMNIEHRGVDNAYKTLFLGGGADVKVIGANLEQIDFKSIQGRGETRVAAAGGVPPIIVGLSEGLSSSTYSNYGQAMRRFGDLTMAGLWGNAAGSLAALVPPPGSDSRLWYDARDVAFLREDAKARADVEAVKASTINIYITAGFTPESAVASVESEDPTLLVHTGLTSVQLQPPGTGTGGSADGADPAAAGEDDTAPAASGSGSSGRAARLRYGTDGRTVGEVLAEQDTAPVGEADDVDRTLMHAARHPHPALALTNGSSR